MVYTYHGMLLSHKKEWSVNMNICYNQHEPQKHAKWKKPDTEVTHCMIPFIWNNPEYVVHRDKAD